MLNEASPLKRASDLEKPSERPSLQNMPHHPQTSLWKYLDPLEKKGNNRL
jgi:hypothetical protein